MDDDSVLRTPGKDDSGLDSLIEASTSLHVTDDSLADVLQGEPDEPEACLLYTSDAADE